MAAGKSPGIDGLPQEFYLAFQNKLTPLLLSYYKEVIKNGCFSPSSNIASIILIPKKNKDPLLCESQRPLSILNCDIKIFAKVISNRLERVITKLVHPDQVGFIKQRYGSDSIRRLLNIKWANRNSPTPSLALALDAEKAFDRVEWGYLFKALEKYGFGPNFTRCVRSLYSGARASVITNGISSCNFELHRGTRQGCPLSPLLFVLALEPLAIAIRQNADIVGVSIGNEVHKLSLYADDIILFLSQPSKSIGSLLNTIKQFSSFSGYKVNWSKTEAFPLSDLAPMPDVGAFNISTPKHGIKYLGIKFPLEIKNIQNINYANILEEMKMQFDRWKGLNLSLWGKISSIKMMVYPKLFYLFNMLPVQIPNNIYKQIDKLINAFLWSGKKARFSLATLQTPKRKGGFNLPNLQLYHWAFTLHKFVSTVRSVYPRPSWACIEQHFMSPAYLEDALHIKQQRADEPHPCLSYIYTIWKSIHKLTKETMSQSSWIPIWNNPFITINKKPIHWTELHKSGISKVADLYTGAEFKSFLELNTATSPYCLPWWKYFQLRSAIVNKYKDPPRATYWDNCLLEKDQFKINAPEIYKELIDKITSNFKATKALWSTDLGCDITEDEWNQIWIRAHTVSKEVSLKLTQLKTVHRYHWTPSKLHRAGLRPTGLCWRCSAHEGTYLHMIWDCRPIKKFWTEVCRCVSKITRTHIEPDPAVCLLGIFSRLANQANNKWLAIAFTVAKKLLYCHWKGTSAPSIQVWFNVLIKIAKLERVIYCNTNSVDKYEKVWSCFLTAME